MVSDSRVGTTRHSLAPCATLALATQDAGLFFGLQPSLGTE